MEKRAFILLFFMMVLFAGCRQQSDIPPPPGSKQKSPSYTAPLPQQPAEGSAPAPAVGIKHEKIYSFSLHYPENLQGRYPLILFIPGWGSVHYEDYRTLIDFLVRRGSIVLFAPEYADEYATLSIRQELEDIYRLCSVREHMDTSRFGVVGHSSGGGKAFAICRYFARKGWGKNGRFIFAMAPWFAFDMGQEQMRSIPENTYVVMELFGDDGSTDPRIPMTIYSLLTQIPPARKTFYLYPGVGHGYPAGSGALSKMEGVTEPLGAVMDAAFQNRKEDFAGFDRLGSDAPWQAYRKIAEPSLGYPFSCRPASPAALYDAVQSYDIDYCAILPVE